MAKTILLVEDSQDDEFLCKEVLKKVVFNSVMTVRDGSQAIAYLNGQGKFADRQRYPLPDVVLLDLQMPVLDGFQVLEWFKTQPDLNKMLVVVLSQFGQTRD